MTSDSRNIQKDSPDSSSMRRWRAAKTGALLSLLVMSLSVVPRAAVVWILGDSTASTYSANTYPLTGWGHVLQLHLDSTRFKVRNRAVPGASIVSFASHANWKNVTDSMRQGDIVIVQFGHNSKIPGSTAIVDSAMFTRYLDTFALAARAHGALPLFATPINKNFWARGVVFETFCQPGNNFWQAMLVEGARLGVPVVDLEKATTNDQILRGHDYAQRFLYMGLDSGEYANYPNGSKDSVHLQEMGALNVAGLFAKALASHPDPAVDSLRKALLPCDSLVVLANPEDVELVTSSGCYPKGARVTLKCLPRKGKVFKNWSDGNGALVDPSPRHIDTMAGRRIQRTPVFAPDTAKSTRLPPPIRHGRNVHFDVSDIVLRATTLDGRQTTLVPVAEGSWNLPKAGVYILEAFSTTDQARWMMVTTD